jgi:dihydrofolate reductase
VQTLLGENLVDELRLMIEPVLLGGGKQIFPDDGEMRTLELVSTVPAATGVIVCTYRPVKPRTRIQVPLMEG